MAETEAHNDADAASLIVVGPTEWRFTTRAAETKSARQTTAAQPSGELVTHRVARLFVAGTYADKNLTVTEADLDGLIARFHADGARKPVQIEHIVSALDPLGEVVGLHRSGGELYGLLAFSSGVEAHLQKRGVENVSVALIRETGDGDTEGGFSLKEVSLVLKGRIPSATLLEGAHNQLNAHAAPGAVLHEPATKGGENTATEHVLARFRAQGKLTPATEPLAAFLLSSTSRQRNVSSESGASGASGAFVFNEGASDAESVADVFARFLDATPSVCPRTPLAGAHSGQMRYTPGTMGASRAASEMASKWGVSPEALSARIK